LNSNQGSIQNPQRRVALLVFDGCQILDVCGPSEVFGFAERVLQLSGHIPGSGFSGRPAGLAYPLSVFAEKAGPVTTLSGMRIVADHAIGEADEDIDTLIVTGGFLAEVRKNQALLPWIKRMAGRVRRLASICTGAFLLADSGLLDGRRVTTHWYYCDQLAREFPNITVEPDRIAVRDGGVYSSGGITAGIDLALSLVEEDWGRQVAAMTGRWLLMFPNRPGGQSQFSMSLMNGFGSRRDFLELQDWIVAHPGEDLSVEALARRMAMSPRHFARTFEREVGLTPAKFVELARLERARAQLEQTLLPVEIIARECGFGTPEHMRRTFQRTLKVSPQDYRARFRITGHVSKPRAESLTELIS
jgi:transcriptional regulator GlxA family with amidase domain